MIQKVLETPNPILKQKSRPIEKIDEQVFELAKDLIETKKANFGLGLAAPQIGILKRMIVVEENPDLKPKKAAKVRIKAALATLAIFANPEIISTSEETEILEEGCLSLAGISCKVERPKKIEVQAIKIDAIKKTYKEVKFKATGILARIIQHETDHLDGILFTDRVTDISTIKQVPIPYKVVFAGTPEFSATILKKLVKNGWGISMVIAESDKPSGRRKVLIPPPVKKIALKNDFVLRQPKEISNLKSQISNLKPDLIIVAAFGQLLPKSIFEIPKSGAICVHPSLLPKYRGASPIQAAILQGDAETGVTIFKIDEKVDTGPLIASRRSPVADDITAGELTKQLARLGAKLLNKTLPDYLEGKIKPKPQNEKKASWTKKITKEDGYIEKSDFQVARRQSLEKIERKIRAFYPWPKVWTVVNGKRVIIHKAHLSLVAGRSSLVADIVQPEGKKPMKYEEYLRGNPKIT